jgi:hypothetical protein
MTKDMNNIKQEQDFDSLSQAEKITGKSYKEDSHTSHLGLLLQIDHSNKMNKLMESTDDTKFSEKTEDYIRKVTEFGFKEVYKEDFQGKNWEDNPATESFYIFWHDEYSILLCFDTFTGSRNSGHFYYNWIPNAGLTQNLTSSGSYVSLNMKPDFSGDLKFSEEYPKWDTQTWEEFREIDDAYRIRLKAFREENGLIAIWSGDHDCREALKNNINLLAQNGTFMKEWLKAPYLWIFHHGDKLNNFDDSVAEARIGKLPVYIQDAIRGKEND